MLPNGSSGKNYIREITRLMNQWVEGRPMKNISLKAIHIMPSILLQKPSKNSKSKDRVRALERRMILWHNGHLEELFNEAKAIQQQLQSKQRSHDIAIISKQFKILMQKGNVNGALKLLTNNMSGGVLPVINETLELLIQNIRKPLT